MARPVEPEPLAGPVRFGPYTLVRRIGAGGMGEVFLAREESPRRACVVKKVLPQLMQSPQFVGRFRDEARVVVRLAHPNIARVYAMGEVDGQLYLSMEYVRGKTLSRLSYRLRQLGRMMPLGIVLHLGQRLCEGLAYAHDATDEEGHGLHLVHRDLSPANVCISYSGEVKIIDFGAAQSTLKEQQTAPRVVIGNLTYMSPEQARKRFVDRRADLYAVGVLLWELCAWKPLSQRGDPVERWRRAAYPQWEPAGKFREGLPSSVDAFLSKAMAPEPVNRFPDGAAMGAELARLKAKLTPGVGDAELAKLMALVFPREKKAEETLLEELLREEARRAHTEPEFAATLTPPTALAFEHSALEAPDDYVPSEGVQVVPSSGPDEDEQTQTDKPPARATVAQHPRANAHRDDEDDQAQTDKPPARVSVAQHPRANAHRDDEDERTQADKPPTRVAVEHPRNDVRRSDEDERTQADKPPTRVAVEHPRADVRRDDEDERTQADRPPASVAVTQHPRADVRRDDEDAQAQPDKPPARVAVEHPRADVRRDTDEDEPTAVATPPGSRSMDPAVTMPLRAEEIAARTSKYGAASENGSSPVSTPRPMPAVEQGSGPVPTPKPVPKVEQGLGPVPTPKPVPTVEATEALDAAKVLVAIEQATAVRASGPRESLFPGRGEDTVTPPMPSSPPRRLPRETQVGFGVDISQTVATEAIEARRLELVRAITGEGEAPAVAPEPAAEEPQGPRVWLAVALFAGASLLGLAVAWLTVWR
ncbi:serine/threonine protein kinase [Myxococcus stipitatus]|uniref:serine/threonine protein kinase n=1 Tax=Myxococcus stipitatus TaxID=83455 RepID=UPI0030D0BBAF